MCGTGCAAQGGLNFVRNLVDNKNRGMGGGQRITCHEVAEYFFCPRKLYIRTLGADIQARSLDAGRAYHALTAEALEGEIRQRTRPLRVAKAVVWLVLLCLVSLLLLS